MPAQYDISKDLKEAVAMADALVPYIHESELYGSTGGGFFSTMPRLTVGGLLLRLRRLDALRDHLDATQLQELNTAMSRHEEVFRTWRTHYEGKLQREALSRLKAMGMFFDECASNPRACAGNYGPEASRRTIVQELIRAMHERKVDASEVEKQARSVDNRLQAVTRHADFIWDDTLTGVYPRSEFWWLYQAPPAADKR